MKAMQYIYTSWKNGDLPDKGFMVYSRSKGLTDEECDNIKYVMQYKIPNELSPNPTPEEIKADFPFSFSFFRVSPSRLCVAQTTYLGRDYSNRFGNYIIYALVFEEKDLDIYPAYMFGEDFIKTFMTEEELNAVPPVPPLPKLDIRHCGSVINDETLCEFISENEDEFNTLICASVEAFKHKVPLYINDTRENLVYWVAALHRILPLDLTKHFGFVTYAGNHEKFLNDKSRSSKAELRCLGVMPAAMGFNYSMAAVNSRHVVVDFISGVTTKDIPNYQFADYASSVLSLDPDMFTEFSDFVGSTSYSSFSDEIENAYLAYSLCHDDKFDDDESAVRIIDFADKYCNTDMRNEIAVKLLKIFTPEKIVSIDILKHLLPFLYENADSFIYSIHEIFYNAMFDHMADSDNSEQISEIVNIIKEKIPDIFNEFLEYFGSGDIVRQSQTYLDGNDNLFTNIFFLNFILENYFNVSGTTFSGNLVSLIQKLLHNISRNKNSGESMISIIKKLDGNTSIIVNILSLYMEKMQKSDLVSFAALFGSYLNELPENSFSELLSEIAVQPKTKQFVQMIHINVIRQSSDPQSVFWNIYESYYSGNEREIGDITDAYFSMDSSTDAAIKILKNISYKRISSPELQRKLVNTLNSLSIKEIMQSDKYAVKTAYKIVCGFDDRSRYQKISDSYMYFYISLYQEQKGFQTHHDKLHIFSDRLDKKDYKNYVEKSVPVYGQLIFSTGDFEALAECMYNPEYYDIFTNALVGYLRNIRKQSLREWVSVCSYITAYIIDNENNANKAKILAPEIIKYFKKLDEDDLEDVQNASLRMVRNKDSDFFERINVKETLGDKIGKLFKKGK